MATTRGGIIKCDSYQRDGIGDGIGGMAVGIFYDVRCSSACWSATKRRATFTGVVGLVAWHSDKNCVKYDDRFLNFETGNRL